MRDYTFGWEMRTWARMQTKTARSRVYLYYFSHVPPSPNAAWVRAQHGAEIPYAFNWPTGKYSTETSWTAVDRKLGGEVSSYWVNFAATGDPNGKGLPRWPAYQSKDDLVLEFGDTIAVAPVPHKAALDFLDGYFDRLRRSGAVRQSTAR